MASLRLKRGLEADRANITPLAGELILTTDENKLYAGDGSTPGGVLVSGAGSTYSDSNVTSLLASLGANAISSTANITTTGNLVTETKAISLVENVKKYWASSANTDVKNYYYGPAHVSGGFNGDLPGGVVRWEGLEPVATLYPDWGAAELDCISVGIQQFTGNTFQSYGGTDAGGFGPRLVFSSYYGKITDAANVWYPRSGQEIGRIGFHGPRQNRPHTEQPAQTNNFMSVVANNDWTNGSFADTYLVGRTKGDNPNSWASYTGNVMLASGGIADGAAGGNIRFSHAANHTTAGVAYGSQNNAYTDFAVAGFDDNVNFTGAKLVTTNGPGGEDLTNGNFRLGIERNNNSAGMDGTQSYHFTLPSGSNDLVLQSNTSANIMTMNSSTVSFGSVPVLPSYSNVALPSAVAGGMIYVTNGNDKPAYSNGTNWYYMDNTQVT